MSGLWNGNLRNSFFDVVIDTFLVALTVCAYIPQITRLRPDVDLRGISPYYILFNVFFSNAHLSVHLLCAAYAWPTASRPVLPQIEKGNLKGLEAYGAILGLLQVFVQWSLSIVILISYVHAGGRGANGISISAFAHTALVVFTIAAITLPSPPDGRTFERGIVIALISMSNFVVAPCFVILQFIAQFLELKARNGTPGALSLLSVALQMIAMTALGIRWFLRLGHPNWEYGSPSLWLWYQWGFAAINYLIYGVGCAFLLACYLFAAWGKIGHGQQGEQAPLLS